MSAAMIASTVESIRRSRNSLVERSSCSSARSAVTSRNARITAPVPASTVEVDTETHDRRARRRRQLEVERVDVDAGEHARRSCPTICARWSPRDEIDELAAEQAVAREAGDALGRAVDEQDAAGVVEDDHAVGAGLEVLLERVDAAQPALGLVARARDPVRLIAQALEHGAVAQVRGGDARDQLAELDARARRRARRPASRLRSRIAPSARPRHCTGNTAIAADAARRQHVGDRARSADGAARRRSAPAQPCGSPRRSRGTRRSRA